MSGQKLPVWGTFFENLVNVPGQTGPNYNTGVVTQPTATEVSIARFKLSGAAIVVSGGVATVTLASHLNTILGQQVTFSGCTGAGAVLNGQTFTITSITSSSVYSFPTSTPDNAGVTGTIVQEPVFTLPAGQGIIRCDANVVVEYNSDNNFNSQSGQAVTAPTWKVLYTGNATPVVGPWISDGWAVRIRCSGTTATSYFNVIN